MKIICAMRLLCQLDFYRSQFHDIVPSNQTFIGLIGIVSSFISYVLFLFHFSWMSSRNTSNSVMKTSFMIVLLSIEETNSDWYSSTIGCIIVFS